MMTSGTPDPFPHHTHTQRDRAARCQGLQALGQALRPRRLQVMPSVHLIEFRSYCGRCAAIVNSSNTPVKVTYDYRLSNNYFSSRPQAVVTDVVPTRSRCAGLPSRKYRVPRCL